MPTGAGTIKKRPMRSFELPRAAIHCTGDQSLSYHYAPISQGKMTLSVDTWWSLNASPSS
jgi:hypothetical protein